MRMIYLCFCGSQGNNSHGSVSCQDLSYRHCLVRISELSQPVETQLIFLSFKWQNCSLKGTCTLPHLVVFILGFRDVLGEQNYYRGQSRVRGSQNWSGPWNPTTAANKTAAFARALYSQPPYKILLKFVLVFGLESMDYPILAYCLFPCYM